MTAPVPPTVHVLGSFHYLRRADLPAVFSTLPARIDFLADSGAFSAHNSGAVVTVEDYAAWLVRNAPAINAAATLDVIGDPHATEVNTRRLRDLTEGRVPIVPTFHVGSPWPELERLCAASPYVALGGAVALQPRVQAMSRWLVTAHRIARDHNTRLHGFGLTRPPYPELLPWYSVDSSYWSSASRTGSLSLWDGRRFVGMRVGRPAAAAHAALIRRYGGNPARAATPGFGIVGRSGPLGSDESKWMAAASALSLWRYGQHIKARRGPVPPPRTGRTTGDGLKVYLAAGSIRDIGSAVAAVAPAVADHILAS